MRVTKTASGLIIPVEKKKNHTTHPNGIPMEERFTNRMFRCHYECDIERFQQLVEDTGGKYCGYVETPFRNIWNQELSNDYIIIYQYTEDIEMAVCC